MAVYVAKRVGLAIIVALTVSVLAFCLTYIAGDPAIAMAGEGASPEEINLLRKSYGFDRPLTIQYLDWLAHALRGDFGQSLYYNMPVAQLIAKKLPVSATLGVCAMLFALLVAVPLGVLAAIRPNSWIDRTALTISVFGQALPSFWFALLLIVLFSVMIPVLPPSGTDSWQHFIMPTVALGYYAIPGIMRLTRGGMQDALASDYIRTARAKGLRPMVVLFRHALRNAIIPVVSLGAVQFGQLLSGSVVIESIFSINGAGYMAWSAIQGNDLPTIQAILLIFSSIFVGLTLFADLLNAWLDPRIRMG